jgi:hypothetical protein
VLTEAQARKLKSAQPPYRLCWWCNRQFQSYRGVQVQSAGGEAVWVHRWCATKVPC